MKPGRPPVAERKDAVLSVRLTDAEYTRVLALAAAAHEELSVYVRQRLVSVNINTDPPPFVQR